MNVFCEVWSTYDRFVSMRSWNTFIISSVSKTDLFTKIKQISGPLSERFKDATNLLHLNLNTGAMNL